MSNILFVHQNFPGQFPFIAEALLKRGDKVAAIGSVTAKGLPGVDVRRWNNTRSSTPGLFEPAVKAEADLIRADCALNAALALKADGFVPDVIVGHPGWGETIYLKEAFPNARQILLSELFYQAHGGDVNFDPEFDREGLASSMRVIAKNATATLAMAYADKLIVPTSFQAASFPPVYGPITRVLHEGVDLERARRDPGASMILADGRRLDGSTPVITFINRSLERVRGFHIFMRALPELLAAEPHVDVVIMGQHQHNRYGDAPPGGGEWKDWMLAEVGHRLDLNRVHFLGRVAHPQMIDALSISWAHVYYTYPFVLSWSLIEAMGCECLILGSNTDPLHDAVVDGYNGILNDFFDVKALTAAMLRAVREPEAFTAMRKAARESVFAKFDRATVGVPGWLEEIDALL